MLTALAVIAVVLLALLVAMLMAIAQPLGRLADSLEAQNLFYGITRDDTDEDEPQPVGLSESAAVPRPPSGNIS